MSQLDSDRQQIERLTDVVAPPSFAQSARAGAPVKIDDAALAVAIGKMRKLRLIDHVPIKDSSPPAVTFLAVMKQGLGGCYEDAALEYIFRHFLKYYERERA